MRLFSGKQVLATLAAFAAAGCSLVKEAVQPELNVNYPAAYVVNGQSSTVTVINLTTNQVAGIIPLVDKVTRPDGSRVGSGAFLAYPHHLSLHPSETQLAIAAPGVDLSAGHGEKDPHGGVKKGGKVAILDAVTGTVRHILSLPDPNHNAVFSPDGNEIWSAQMDHHGKVLVYDAKTYTLKHTIPVGAEPAEVTFSADGSVAFVANGADNTVTAIDPLKKSVVATISVGKNPVGAWPGADGRMYVDNEDGKTISVLDVKTLKVVETVDLGFVPDFAFFLSAQRELWVTDGLAGKVHWWRKEADGRYTYGGSLASGAGAHAIGVYNGMAYITNQKGASVSVVDVAKHLKVKDISVDNKPNGIAILNR
ncbi:hypothetical protein GCM10023187_20310 [Nibrella viscosa]|uniref:40-residue YVTN family beta-propeller repeat-containing protein n=1 Tax=Nibrella viscosa TaxID=1084524 RepID=A0ABP8KDH4_9BACT